MRILTAGESHGKGLVGILDGVPSGFSIDLDVVNAELRRRQGGYGRGARMKIENDEAEFYAGLRGGVTLGSPIAVVILNKDYQNWISYTHPFSGDVTQKQLTAVRPGHADLSGCIKYNTRDARFILERASARETAMRVALGSVCKQILASFGVTVASRVVSIGAEIDKSSYKNAKTLNSIVDKSEVRCIDKDAEKRMKAVIDKAKANGDTVGGEVELVISGVPTGIGSHTQLDRKLDYALTGLLSGIQSVKYVAIGDGAFSDTRLGSDCHDEIYLNGDTVARKTNHAGGIEGGISNGEDIVIKLGIKPIPTLSKGLNTIDIVTLKPCKASTERSDVCAVPAVSVVAEGVVAYGILDQILTVTGFDSASDVIKSVNRLREKARLK